jgi:hypothetical protein
MSKGASRAVNAPAVRSRRAARTSAAEVPGAVHVRYATPLIDMSSDGLRPDAPTGCGAVHAVPASGRTTANTPEAFWNATARRPLLEAATTGAEAAAARPASTRSGGCQLPSISRDAKTWSTPPSRLT